MKGIGASPGVAIGRVFIDWREQIEVEKEYVEDARLEADRLMLALETVRDEIIAQLGAEAWESIEDPAWLSAVRRLILSEKVTAPWALKEISDRYESQFLGVDSSGRADRISDLTARLNRLLLHMETVLTPDDLPGPVVLVCSTVSREDMAMLQGDKVVGLVCEEETQWSHGVIAARNHEIPAVIGLSAITDVVDQGDLIVLDGDTGEVVVNPDEELQKHYETRRANQQAFHESLRELIGKPVLDADGSPVVLRGNAATFADVERLVGLSAGGIGLYRTEYLYLSRAKLPSEGEQFYDYKRAVTAMQGCPVVFRTLDIGGDKTPSYLATPKELNPALGHRGIRYSLSRVDIFRDQLRALLAASAFGDLCIMLPMVTSVLEVRSARAVLEDLKEEMRRADEPFNPNVQLGVMIETPAAAMEADLLAREVDFLSIGTNDLLQYSLAVDRNNPALAQRFTPFSPGCLRMLRDVVQKAVSVGTSVAICGEMAGDPLLLPLLYGMGLRHFSVNPQSLLHTQWIVSKLHFDECAQWAGEVLRMTTAKEIRQFCIEHFQSLSEKE